MEPSNDGKSSLTGSQDGTHVLDYLANFIENSLDAIVASDSAGRIVFWNLAAERMFGWNAREALGRSPTELFWPTKITENQEDQEQSQLRLQQGEVIKGEEVIRCKDGSPLWVAYTTRTVIDNGNDNISGYVAVYRDISERKRAEEQLRTTLESIKDGFFACDADWRFVYVNAQAERILGIRREEVLGVSHWEVFPLTLGTNLEQEYRCAAAGEVRDFENFYEPWGRWFHHRCFPREGGGMSVYFEDITDRKQAAEQLERSNQKLQEILASIQEDFYVLDQDWKVVYANRQFTSKVGKEPQDFVGHNFWEMFPKHVGGALYENFHAAMEKREVRRFEMPGKYTDAWYRVAVFPSEEGITVLGRDITERKRMEREIESLARFPQENPNPVLRIHSDGVIAFANASSDSLLRLWKRAVGERLPEIEHKLILQSLETHSAIEQDVDCAGRIYSLIFTPVVTSGYVNIYGRDVTERKQVEEALRRAQLDLERAQEVGQTGNWRLDVRKNILTWSDEIYRIFAVPLGTPMSYETFLDIVHPDDRQYVDTHWKAGLTGAPYDIEHRIIVGGRVKWVREKAYLEFDEAGSLLGGFGISQDITERKRAEQNLRESEERFRTLANAVPSIVWTAAPDGTILYSNELWYKYTGISPDDNATNWAELVLHPDDFDRCVMEWTHALETVPDEYLIEVRNRRFDGEYRWFQTRAIPIRDGDGKVTAWYGVTTDIHDRVEAVHAMRESQQQLQFLNETLEQKVGEQTAEVRRLASELTKVEQRERGRIAHILHEDLQQRLYVVKMNLGLLADKHKLDPVMDREFVETNKQLDEILSLTRNLTVELSPPILQDEGLKQAFEWLATQMYAKQGLHIEIQAEGSFAIRDEAIQVLLFNCVRELLFNIVKHAEVNQAVVALQRSGNDLRIEVRDEGKGFDVAALMGSNQNKTDENKTKRWTFGLPTLRHQLGLFGGQMDVQSEPGAGTCITITIPYS